MKIIIIGCGRMGVGLAHDLSRSGHAVTIIDQDPAAFELLGPSMKEQRITGVGFDRDVLQQAHIEQVDALAAVTSSDEANAVIARLAKQVFRVPRVAARLCDQRKKAIYQRMGIQTVDPTTWAIRRMVDLLCYSPLNTVLSLGNGSVDVVEIEVPALLVGRQVRELTVAGEIVVIAVNRGGRTFIPTLGTLFQANDLLYLSAATSSNDRLKALLGLA
ncbi:MAG: TrkA family potassium uptake protein [Clostridiaceae bacterium]|nr:TrkA family potassium uptake protein [Clostridiaceae bacterium]